MPEHPHRLTRSPDGERGRYQDDPWVQHLVARRAAGLTVGALVVAAASATVRCAARFADDPAHAEAYAAWRARSYRKVCLQARPNEWRRLLREHGDELALAGVGVDGEPLVAAAVPRERSATSHVLGRVLQAYRQETPAATGRPLDVPACLLVENAPLGQSPGKLAAQAGHAALLLVDSVAAVDPLLGPSIAAWIAAGAPCELARCPDAATWRRLVEDEDCVVVRDGGLTEVAPGSQTALALVPRRWAERPAAVRALPLVG